MSRKRKGRRNRGATAVARARQRAWIKNVEVLVRLADRHYVLERGRVRWTGTSAEQGRYCNTVRRFIGV